MFLLIQGCESELKISLRHPRGGKISLDLCRAAKKCRKCVFFLFSFLFIFFGGGVLEHSVFLNNISNYFPDACK